MFDAYPSAADLAQGGDNGVGWILTAGDFNDIVRELICAGERLPNSGTLSSRRVDRYQSTSANV